MVKNKKLFLILLTLSIFFFNATSEYALADESYTSTSPIYMNVENLPVKYSSKTTSVKDQGSDGLCWDYAGITTLETLLKNNGFGNYDFSEEQIKWAATCDEKGYGWSRNINDGCPSQTIPGLFISGNGPVLENSFENGLKTKPNNLYNLDRPFDITEIVYVKTMEEVKNAIINYGAVESCYYDNDYYRSGSLNESYYCNYNYIENHSVAIIGWDDTYSKDNFNKACMPKHNGAWLVKNSWGSDKFDKGFMWISYDDVTLLNTSNGNVNYAIKTVSPHDTNKKIYQYDKFGATSTFTLSGNFTGSLMYANSYDFTGNNTIESVIFQNDNVGANYSIYYAPMGHDGTLYISKKVELASGTIEFSGYIEAKTNKFNIPEGKGLIIVELSGNNINTFGCEAPIYNSYGNLLFNADAKANRSYIIYNTVSVNSKGEQVTNKNAKDIYNFGPFTLSIKAIVKSNNTEDVSIKSTEDNAISNIVQNAIPVENTEKVQTPDNTKNKENNINDKIQNNTIINNKSEYQSTNDFKPNIEPNTDSSDKIKSDEKQSSNHSSKTSDNTSCILLVIVLTASTIIIKKVYSKDSF